MHQSQATLINGLPEDAGKISRFSFQQFRNALGPLLGHAHVRAKTGHSHMAACAVKQWRT